MLAAANTRVPVFVRWARCQGPSDDRVTALSDHRAGGIRGLAARLGGIAPAAGTSIVRSRLFIKYVALFEDRPDEIGRAIAGWLERI
jgi:hypothetical protein